jgi:hypothetical protein
MKLEHFWLEDFHIRNQMGPENGSNLHRISRQNEKNTGTFLILLNYFQSEDGGKNLPTAWITKSISSSVANQARLNLRTFTSQPNVYYVQQKTAQFVVPYRLYKHKCSVSATVKRWTILTGYSKTKSNVH